MFDLKSPAGGKLSARKRGDVDLLSRSAKLIEQTDLHRVKCFQPLPVVVAKAKGI